VSDNPFSNLHLRRLWWGISKPSFLAVSESVSYFKNSNHEEELYLILKSLDENHQLLNDHFEGLGAMPMGRYFEQLLIFALEKDPYYEVLASNVQIVDQKITVGELDLVIWDRLSEEKVHWEVALKFYLQVGNTGHHDNFIGPSRRDYLGRKMTKLYKQQMPLAQHPKILKEFGPLPSRLFLKGQLFYPFLKRGIPPNQGDGHADRHNYMSIVEFENWAQKDQGFLLLKKPNWIGPAYTKDAKELLYKNTAIALLKSEIARIDRPQLIAEMQTISDVYIEKQRFFICPNTWP
jgi:hypothetical protein